MHLGVKQLVIILAGETGILSLSSLRAARPRLHPSSSYAFSTDEALVAAELSPSRL